MTTQPEIRNAHPYHMHDAMLGQPDAIARVLREEGDAVGELARRIAGAERVHIVGIGTSWHASLVGEHMLRMIGARDDARAWNAFEFCAYPPTLGPKDAVIVMNHRGTKRYSARALEMAKAAGATTAIVTGIGSEAGDDAANVVLRSCPQEKSAAFTISHTAAMTLLAMLAVELGQTARTREAEATASELGRLPEQVQGALDSESDVRRWAGEVKDAERLYFVGWGPNVSTAYEAPLKIKETSYVVTEGFQLEQYLHGLFSATDPRTAVTFIAPPGAGRERVTDEIGAVKAVGGHAVAIVEEGDTEIPPLVDTTIYLPETVESLTPLVYLVPLQLFTYWLALELGRNPDLFRQDDPDHRVARAKYQL